MASEPGPLDSLKARIRALNRDELEQELLTTNSHLRAARQQIQELQNGIAILVKVASGLQAVAGIKQP